MTTSDPQNTVTLQLELDQQSIAALMAYASGSAGPTVRSLLSQPLQAAMDQLNPPRPPFSDAARKLLAGCDAETDELRDLLDSSDPITSKAEAIHLLCTLNEVTARIAPAMSQHPAQPADGWCADHQPIRPSWEHSGHTLRVIISAVLHAAATGAIR